MRKNPQPTWSDVKAKLIDLDRDGLIGLMQNLYAVSGQGVEKLK